MKSNNIGDIVADICLHLGERDPKEEDQDDTWYDADYIVNESGLTLRRWEGCDGGVKHFVISSDKIFYEDDIYDIGGTLEIITYIPGDWEKIVRKIYNEKILK